MDPTTAVARSTQVDQDEYGEMIVDGTIHADIVQTDHRSSNFGFGTIRIIMGSAKLSDGHFNLPKETFQYEPLNKGQFRLFRLHPGKPLDPIHCSLVHKDLGEYEEYMSLSYIWGDPKSHRPILLSNENLSDVESRSNGEMPWLPRLRHVSGNLVDGLRILRANNVLGPFWADGICMDQNNWDERHDTLMNMTSIYRNASLNLWFITERDLEVFRKHWRMEAEDKNMYSSTFLRSKPGGIGKILDVLTLLHSADHSVASSHPTLLVQARNKHQNDLLIRLPTIDAPDLLDIHSDWMIVAYLLQMPSGSVVRKLVDGRMAEGTTILRMSERGMRQAPLQTHRRRQRRRNVKTLLTTTNRCMKLDEANHAPLGAFPNQENELNDMATVIQTNVPEARPIPSSLLLVIIIDYLLLAGYLLVLRVEQHILALTNFLLPSPFRDVVIPWSGQVLPFMAQLLRPRVQEGRVRLEWTCSCGKAMYGDYAKRENLKESNLVRSLPGCRPTIYRSTMHQNMGSWWSKFRRKGYQLSADLYVFGTSEDLQTLGDFLITMSLNLLSGWSETASNVENLYFTDRLRGQFHGHVHGDVPSVVPRSVTLATSMSRLLALFQDSWACCRLSEFSFHHCASNLFKLAYVLTTLLNFIRMIPLYVHISEVRQALANAQSSEISDSPDSSLSEPRSDGNSLQQLSSGNSTVSPSSGQRSDATYSSAHHPTKPTVDTSISTPLENSSTSMPSYFELCVNRSKTLTSLGEITLVSTRGEHLISNDIALFGEIRKRYEQLKRKRLHQFLYRPVDIHFVRFGVQQRGFQTGIYQSPMAIPPEIEVKEKRYHYFECPLDPLPPMDPRTFFHYFWEHASHPTSSGHQAFDTLFYNRLPKKLGNSIFMDSSPGRLNLGWGVHIIEGPNKPLLAWIVTVILTLSFVVSVTCAVLLDDKEIGFAIGSWMVAVLSASLMAVYFDLGSIA